MSLPVKASLTVAKVLTSEGSSKCSQSGSHANRYPAYCSFVVGAGGGQSAALLPLSKSRDGKYLLSGFIDEGPSDLAKDDSQMNIGGKHFFFDKKCEGLERTRGVIPPLPRVPHLHRPGNPHPFSLSKELSHSLTGQPFTLGSPERCKLNARRNRDTFSVENCDLSRPKVNYPTYKQLTAKGKQENQPYPDPMVGASCSFIQRISQLSSLEGETMRQEKLKKMRKSSKTSS